MNQTQRRTLPFYPFLIGIYAIVFLRSVNLGQVKLAVTVRSVIVSLAVSLIIFSISFALLRSLHKAALASGLLLVVVFLYGQFFDWVDGRSLLVLAVGRHRLFLPLVVLLTLAGLFFIFATRKNLESLSVVLNVVVLGLIVMAALPILAYQVRYGGSADRQPDVYTVTERLQQLELYSTITPVNTFRVLFNQFFARSYSLLPDTLLVKDVSADGQASVRRVPAACDAR